MTELEVLLLFADKENKRLEQENKLLREKIELLGKLLEVAECRKYKDFVYNENISNKKG